VSKHTILVESVEKYFPPAYSGWRALLQPLARPTMRALAGVSLSVEPGEVLALVGANGAGKSTLLRILATLIIPTRGRAFVEGFDVEREPDRVLQQIGYHTGGDEGFYGRLTSRENLEFFAAMNNRVGADAARRIDQVAELMGIAQMLDRQVRTFSTGMRHRLGLARAFLHGPAVLLLDEPTRSLDPLAAAEFRRFLRSDLVRQHGTTLLFASHTLSEVEELADRVAILDAGRLLACDTPRGLRAATGTATLEQAFERLSQRAGKAAPAEALL
jgi:ABC-type multidrug transport system ATPase subunit